MRTACVRRRSPTAHEWSHVCREAGVRAGDGAAQALITHIPNKASTMMKKPTMKRISLITLLGTGLTGCVPFVPII